MKKDFGAKPYIYPMPVLIIATYNDDETANAMNAAWGGVCDYKKISIIIDKSHKTTENILKRKAFTVSIADEQHITEADYLGIVSGNETKNKVEKAGLHCIKSKFVDAPLIEEFPLTLECRLISYDEQTERAIGEVINTAISKIPDDADLVITHVELTGTAKAAQPNKQHLSISNYLKAPEYDELVERFKNEL